MKEMLKTLLNGIKFLIPKKLSDLKNDMFHKLSDLENDMKLSDFKNDLPPEEPELFVITADKSNYEVSHSYDDVLSAYDEGKQIVLKLTESDDLGTMETFLHLHNFSEGAFSFKILNSEIEQWYTLSSGSSILSLLEKDTLSPIFMNKANPSGTGSFSLNRKGNTTVGNYSHAEGYGCESSAYASHAEGQSTTASGSSSHSEGIRTIASGENSHAEGNDTTASGAASHAEGCFTTASGLYSHAEGYETISNRAYQSVQGKHNEYETSTGVYAINEQTSQFTNNGSSQITYATSYSFDENTGKFHLIGAQKAYMYSTSVREGYYVATSYSDSDGTSTIYKIVSKSVSSKKTTCTVTIMTGANVENVKGKYAHIVGNGTSDTDRSNAHTLDWQGNAEYAGDVKANACGGEEPISLVETWKKANEAGGGVFVVNITDNGDGTYSADKTPNEIKEAYDSGKYCIARCGTIDYRLFSMVNTQAQFSSCHYDMFGQRWYRHITIGNGGVSLLEESEIIGNLSTTDKSSLVGAINELYNEIQALKG